MKMHSSGALLRILAMGLVLTSLASQSYGHGELQYGYYNNKCSITVKTIVNQGNTGLLSSLLSRLLPGLLFRSSSPTTTTYVIDVEKIVSKEVEAAYQKDNSIVAALLRLQFHDCFVNGCDASILLDGSNSEKTAIPNQSVRGYDLIDTIKARLESICPGVVSCADIIVMATRDAISLATPLNREGKRWRYSVETGRRDGYESVDTKALQELPPPTISVKDSIDLFGKKGLSRTEMVYLLGGHTVGETHCPIIEDRLYNYSNTGKPDPNMERELLEKLTMQCPKGSNSNNPINLDQNPLSSMTVDNSFYRQLLLKKGVLQFDQDMASSGLTNAIVDEAAKTTYEDFNKNFADAMVKLQRIGVLTGTQGQIRSRCNAVNPK